MHRRYTELAGCPYNFFVRQHLAHLRLKIYCKFKYGRIQHLKPLPPVRHIWVALISVITLFQSAQQVRSTKTSQTFFTGA